MINMQHTTIRSHLTVGFIINKTKTVVINMAIKRMLENKVHLLDVSYVSTYIFRSDR